MTPQQKVCQTDTDFLPTLILLKNFDREKVAKEMLTNILYRKNMQNQTSNTTVKIVKEYV